MHINRRDFIKVAASTLPALSLSGISRAQASQSSASVTVIGAGLSGLYTALLLQDAGFNVTVLEGSSRIGGRVFTADHLDSKHEFGASQVGRSYARTIALCERLKLNLIPEHRDLLPFANYIDKTWINTNDWVNSPTNKLIGDERKIPPALTGSSFLSEINPLKNLDDWLNPKFADYDVSLYDLFKKHGISDAAIKLADATTDLHNASALSLLQEKTRGLFDAKFGGADLGKMDRPYGFDNQIQKGQRLALVSNIEGGASRLPEAMAAQLGDRIHTEKMVRHIDMSGKKAKITCMDDSQYQADYVVSSVPFSVLRNISIFPSLQGPQLEAVSKLHYANTTRAYGLIDEPYWEQDGLEPSIFTNSGIHMLWAIKKRPNENKHRFMVVFTDIAAARLDQMPPQLAMKYIETEVNKIRPSTIGKLKYEAIYSWAKDPMIQGCRHMFTPGQVNGFAKEMIIPHHTLHFAGEHTRRADFGMESALESGERVASEILMRS